MADYENSVSQSVVATSSATPFTAAADRADSNLSALGPLNSWPRYGRGRPSCFTQRHWGSISRNPQFSWQSHAHYLDRVKGHINAVEERAAELQEMRSDVLPWQQQAISEVTASAIADRSEHFGGDRSPSTKIRIVSSSRSIEITWRRLQIARPI